MHTARADTATTNANTAVKIAVLANDAGTSLAILSVTTPVNGTARINTDKTITYTPKTGYTGSDSFTYTIRDSAGKKATGTVSITVRNRAPVAAADSAATNANTSVSVAVLANDSDPDGHSLNVGAVTQPANGTAAIKPDQTITYTPKAGYTGSDSFTYTAADGHGGSSQGTVSVTVRNRPPVAAADTAVTDANAPVTIAVLSNDVDPDGHALKINAVSQPANGTVVINPDKTLTYTPAPGFTGADSFGYTVGDGRGGTAQGTVAITVRNRPPATQPDTAVTDAGVPVDIAVLTNDTDPDGHPVTLSVLGQPLHGSTAANPDGTVRYTPLMGYVGADSFSYTVNDGHGGSAEGNVSVTVRNRSPVAGADAAATDADTQITIAVLGNDSDPDGHPLSVSSVTQPTNGSAAINSDQTIVYSPSTGFIGSDSFTYTVADGRGGSALGTVDVTVRNRPPVAGADTAVTDAGMAVDIAVLANDNDPDGHPLNVAAVAQPMHGVATANPDGTIRYAPAPGFTGTDSFAYTIGDGHGGTAQGTVTMTVRNRPPVAAADQAATGAYAAVQIDALANDGDPDGQTLQIVAITQPANGMANIVGGQALSYSPTPGFMGTDSFSYTIADGGGGTATGTVTITVRAWGEPFGDGSFFTDATGWIPAAA